MRKKLSLSALLICTLPSFAFANITVTNNTNVYATAYFTSPAKRSPCSSQAPYGKGIVAPHTSSDVPSILLWSYCLSGCTAHVYVSRDCSGPEVGSANIDINKGVVSTKDANKGYTIDGTGMAISLNPKAKKWYNFFF